MKQKPLSRMYAVHVLLILGLLNSSCTTKPKAEERKPNVIYILADDLGYGDLSCYGQKKIQTPNIDRLAANGIRFTRHYSGSTVCAPSRSALMTGQHTGHTPIRGNKEVQPIGQHPIADEVVTLAEIFQSQGYVTGAFGKWGLGYPGSEGDPLNQGFNTFFGYNCQRLGHNYYPYELQQDHERIRIEENQGKKEGVYAPELIHERTLTFIEENKDRPFFAYVPSIIPHAELKVPQQYMLDYRGKLLPEKSYSGCDYGCKEYKVGGYGSQSEGHATFAAMIKLLDIQVGQIVDKVVELGIENNTLIVFTSDNGPHLEGGADPDYFNSNGNLRGYKRDLYEGGVRVPMIAAWPGKIMPGKITDHVSAFWDVLPTVTELIGVKEQISSDGISFSPTLLGEEQPKHNFLYWEFHNYQWHRQAVLLDGQWKVFREEDKHKDFGAFEIYDILNDPGETNNLVGSHPDIEKRALTIISNERQASSVSTWRFSTDL